jgi:hypothetical protein
VLRYQRHLLAKGVDRLLTGLGVVVVGLGRVGGREKGRREAVLFNESLGDDKEELGPDLSNGMYTPVSGLNSARDSRL